MGADDPAALSAVPSARAARGPSTTLHERDYITTDTAVPVYASVVEVDTEVAVHGHDFLEIAVVAGGAGTHLTSAGQRSVRTGDVFVLRPGAWHGFTGQRGLVVANCCLGMNALRHDIAFLRDVPALRDLLWTGPVASGRHGVLSTRFAAHHAQQTCQQISELVDQLDSRPGNRVLLLGRLLTVLGGLAEHLADHLKTAPDRSQTARPRLPEALTTAVDLLEGEPEAAWRAEDLASAVSLDPAYLSRLFRRHLGTPPMAYLARIRAERAAALLAREELPIARVGALVGWPDPTYFARRFRALRGITPSAYRRRLRAP